jgi:1-acyl-sn-glycerol-3-phosphate acyltransferase
MVFFFQRLMAAQIAFGSLIFFRTQWEIKRSKLPKSCIYVANHTSYIDIVLSYLFLPAYYVFMAKMELKKVPLFKVFFEKMQISVDRSSRVSSHKAFLRAKEELDLGNSVFIFPEGTISSNGVLKAFKNGPFKLAIDNQVPIVPITFKNNWKILQNGGFFKSYGRPGISEIIIHQPIPTSGMTEENLVDLKQNVYQIISKEYHKKS